ncbi:MAG: hypothetical protein ABL959_20750 [Pyrinomonadaceae bacterium]
MLDENLITTLEQSLDQTRNAQRRLTARLREAEGEVENLRLEINALENSAAQTEKAIHSLLVATRGSRSLGHSFSMDDSMDLNDRSASERGRIASAHRDTPSDNTLNFPQAHRSIPSINSNFEPISKRFNDRTITQACTLLLRESGGPLHVNELYNLLIAGGMTFKGNNPTISVAVSLSRNSRFRKVDPGTFDLVIREANNRAAS